MTNDREQEAVRSTDRADVANGGRRADGVASTVTTTAPEQLAGTGERAA